jgi:hypothetical protein
MLWRKRDDGRGSWLDLDMRDCCRLCSVCRMCCMCRMCRMCRVRCVRCVRCVRGVRRRRLCCGRRLGDWEHVREQAIGAQRQHRSCTAVEVRARTRLLRVVLLRVMWLRVVRLRAKLRVMRMLSCRRREHVHRRPVDSRRRRGCRCGRVCALRCRRWRGCSMGRWRGYSRCSG